MSLNLKKMGISNPIVLRGKNPHEYIQQSALTLDGPALDRSMRNHEFVILASTGRRPAFRHLAPQAGETLDDFLTKLEISSKGAPIAADKVYDPEGYAGEVLDWIRDKIYLVINGSDYDEMPLVKPVFTKGVDSADDACLNLRKGWVGNVVIPAVPTSLIGNIVREGVLSVYADMDPLSVTAGHAVVAPTGLGGTIFAGYTEYPILGTQVISAAVYEVRGTARIVISFTF
jgi:hypothetical protein